MRILPGAALLLLSALAVFGASRAGAQEDGGRGDGATDGGARDTGAPVDAGTELRVLRARGASTWRNYVWSLDRSRLAHSVAELDRARELAGGRADFTQIYLLAFGHLVLGNEQEGRAAAAEARARAPEFGPNELLAAFEAILAGDGRAALAHLDTFVQTVESSPPDSELGAELRFLAYLHRGAQRYELGLHAEAKDDLRTAGRIAEEAGRRAPRELLLRLARAHEKLNEFASAEEIVTGLLHRTPGSAELCYQMGLLAGTQKQLPEARTWYERAVARQRDHRDAHAKLAYIDWLDAQVFPRSLPGARAQLSAHAWLTQRDPNERDLAEVMSGLGCYWLVVARHRVERGHEASAPAVFQRALDAFGAALEHEPGCVRALNSIIQIGTELGWPPERTAPYRERMKAIKSEDEGAPAEVRSSFC